VKVKRIDGRVACSMLHQHAADMYNVGLHGIDLLQLQLLMLLVLMGVGLYLAFNTGSNNTLLGMHSR